MKSFFKREKKMDTLEETKGEGKSEEGGTKLKLNGKRTK